MIKFSILLYRHHRVFIARSKLWTTSQWHTVLESTAMSFIPRQQWRNWRGQGAWHLRCGPLSKICLP